jgi:regulator of protease activity HflC (stomatin/prohibitin superfamily)
MKTWIVAVVIVILAVVVIGRNTSGFVVKAGNVGLVVNHYTGRVDTRIRHAGFNAQPPFSGNELIEIPTYERTYTMVKDPAEGAQSGDDSVLVNTLSSNTLNVDTSITYHIAYDPAHPERIAALYSKYRNQFTDFGAFEEAQLRPAFRQAIVDAFGLASTSQNMTGDGKKAAAAYALKELNDRFNPDSIVIDEVRIRAIYPDEATVGALRSRLQAQQNLKLAQLNLQLQNLVNQKSVLAAEAQAQAAHIRAASLTPRLVKFKHIKDIEIIGVPRGAIVNVPSDEPAPAAGAPADTDTSSGSSQ